jgi:glycerol transport system ATP-binding protein
VDLAPWQVELLTRLTSKNIKIGIRPEFIELSPTASDNTYQTEILDMEDLGTYKIITVQLDQQEMKVRMNEEFEGAIGSLTYLSFPQQWLKLYVDEFLVQEQQ